MQFGKLTVGVGKLESDRACRLAPAAADLGKRVFKSVRQIDPAAEFLSAHRIDDRFAPLIDVAVHKKPGAALVDIDIEINVGEHGIVGLRKRGSEDVENR